jgi:hypothetical protein
MDTAGGGVADESVGDSDEGWAGGGELGLGGGGEKSQPLKRC